MAISHENLNSFLNVFLCKNMLHSSYKRYTESQPRRPGLDSVRGKLVSSNTKSVFFNKNKVYELSRW